MAAAITRDAGVDSRSVTTTHCALWIAVLFDLLAFGVGWDRQWHTMHFFATMTLAHVALRESVP